MSRARQTTIARI